MVRVKICGITSQKDYNTVNRLGADYTGFIFYKKSPRYITPSRAAEINTPERKSLRVGVFVDEDAETVKEIFKKAKLDIVQLHGGESRGYCRNLGLPYIKVFRAESLNSLRDIAGYNTEYILVDTFVKDMYGGTGKMMDTDILAEIIKEADKLGKKIIAAGGINPENIIRILKLKPYAVDINSGVESEPGIKDENKLIKVFSRIKDFGMEA